MGQAEVEMVQGMSCRHTVIMFHWNRNRNIYTSGVVLHI